MIVMEASEMEASVVERHYPLSLKQSSLLIFFIVQKIAKNNAFIGIYE